MSSPEAPATQLEGQRTLRLKGRQLVRDVLFNVELREIVLLPQVERVKVKHPAEWRLPSVHPFK